MCKSYINKTLKSLQLVLSLILTQQVGKNGKRHHDTGIILDPPTEIYNFRNTFGI